MLIVVAPPNVLVPFSTNVVDVGVNLYNFFIVPSAKLRTEYTNNPTLKIGYAFESNRGVTSRRREREEERGGISPEYM
jgi:hypothetical protein